MKILISYATNSGSTYLVAQRLQKLLQDFAHQVLLKEIDQTQVQDLLEADLNIWGSPSWDHRGKEGQPHLAFIRFFEGNPEVDFDQKKFAVFGLGDKHYRYFCGAVGHLEQFILHHHGKLLVESLKIDTYYCNELSACTQIDSWVDSLNKELVVAR